MKLFYLCYMSFFLWACQNKTKENMNQQDSFPYMVTATAPTEYPTEVHIGYFADKSGFRVFSAVGTRSPVSLYFMQRQEMPCVQAENPHKKHCLNLLYNIIAVFARLSAKKFTFPPEKSYSTVSCFGASVRFSQPFSRMTTKSSMRTPNSPGR